MFKKKHNENIILQKVMVSNTIENEDIGNTNIVVKLAQYWQTSSNPYILTAFMMTRCFFLTKIRKNGLSPNLINIFQLMKIPFCLQSFQKPIIEN